MRRRDFLRYGGALGAAAAGATAAGCTSRPAVSKGTHPKPTTSAPTTSVPAPSTSRPPRTTSAPTTSDWSALARSINGRLVRPSSPAYGVDAQSYNPVFNGAHPQAIAYVASPSDASKIIQFGREHAVQLSVRCGGHCYGGWSTGPGLVIDVTELSSVSIARDKATVGAGTRLVDLYNACAAHSVAVPGGSCPTVGIAGLAMGGGLGVVDRQFGLTCDNMLSADVVLASGDVVTCDASEHSDLFWALRGAGGGSFGVVTGFRFSARPIGELAIFTLVWTWASAPRVVAAWQDWAPHAPDQLWSNCLLIASQSTPAGYAPAARVTGVYVGSQAGLETELSHLLSSVPAAPFTRFVGTSSYLDTMLIEAGCEGDSVAECHLPSVNHAGILTRAPFAARSDIVTTPLSATGIRTMLATVEARQTSAVLSGGGIALDAAGGAINRVAPTATAFVHRNALFTMQYSANWNDGAPASVVSANKGWLAQAWGSMRPYVSGQAYQNYADPSLTGWQKAYYGQNLARLEQVKKAYDPHNVFHFPQSIPVGK